MTHTPSRSTPAPPTNERWLRPVQARLQVLASRLDRWAVTEDNPRSVSEELLLDIQLCIQSLPRDYEWSVGSEGAVPAQPLGDLGELRSEVGRVLRQLALTMRRADALPPADYADKPTAADWRGRAEWLAAVLEKTMDRLEDEHLAHLRSVAAVPLGAADREPMNLRMFRDDATRRWFIRGFGYGGNGMTPAEAMKDLVMSRNTFESDQWPVVAPAGPRDASETE